MRIAMETWVGQALRRSEDERLVTGRGQYVDDIARPDALHVAFVRSPYAAAAIPGIDADAARGADGVVAVLTAADLAGTGRPAVNAVVPGMAVQPFEILATARATAVGQPVAAVIATSLDAAVAAAELVEVDYRPEEPVLHLAAAEPALRQQWHTFGVDPAFAAADRIVGVTVRHARVAAMPMEPRHALAAWEDGRLTAWLQTQSPHRAQQDLARILGLDPAAVRVIAPDIGGAFGAKASIFPEDALVAWAARHLGRPVRWRGSRMEDLAAGSHGRGGTLSGELALSADGRMLALRAQLRYPLGAWMPFSAAIPGRNAARILPGPYAVTAVDIGLEALADNAAPMGIYRGAGRPEAAMLMERLADLGARACGLDPLAFRRRNLVTAFPHLSASGQAIDSGDFARLLDVAAERADYAGLRRTQAERRARGEIVGIGIGLYIEPCGHGAEAARISLQADGRLTAATGSTAQGQGRETAFAQLVADALRVAPGAVDVVHGDTDRTPPGLGALASRSTPIGGSALIEAAALLDAKARTVAARLLQAAEVVPAAGGFAVAGDPGRCVDWAGIAQEAPGLSAEAEFTTPSEAWASGCCIAVLAIDAETGVPTIERIVWADDAGTIVNPLLVEGQLLGGLAQGLGEALMERIVYDDAGQLLTGSLMDYALPRATDIPPVTLASAPTRSPNNPLGAKGVGEAGCIGIPAAIVNAAVDALQPYGVTHLDMPLTSETLWRALNRMPDTEDGR